MKAGLRAPLFFWRFSGDLEDHGISCIAAANLRAALRRKAPERTGKHRREPRKVSSPRSASVAQRKTPGHEDDHRNSGTPRIWFQRPARRGCRCADRACREHEGRAAGRRRRAAAGPARYRALCRRRNAQTSTLRILHSRRSIRSGPTAPTKRRWISLPPGSAIDASDPDAWVFPVRDAALEGVLLRREARRDPLHGAAGGWPVALCGLCVERRREQRAARAGARQARRLSARRRPLAHDPGRERLQGVPPGRPQRGAGLRPDSAVADRDPARCMPTVGVDRDFAHRARPARRPAAVRAGGARTAASATERAAAGYLHGNCGHCHNEQGPLRNLALFLRQTAADGSERAIASTFDQPVKKPAPGLPADAVLRIEPQHPDRSALLKRIASRYPPLQMPPLGTELSRPASRRPAQPLDRRERTGSPSTHRPEKGPTQ